MSELDRTPSSIALKRANFAALDPKLDRKGMSGHSRLDGEFWAEFFAAPMAFLERVERLFTGTYEVVTVMKKFKVREGEDVESRIKTRRHTDFFRRTLLASYNGQSAQTGIAQSQRLTSSHIVPWAEDKGLRLDPRNGILLNALHDRAFDQHLITFENGLCMLVASVLELFGRMAALLTEKKLRLPQRFRPAPELLERHRDKFHQKWVA